MARRGRWKGNREWYVSIAKLPKYASNDSDSDTVYDYNQGIDLADLQLRFAAGVKVEDPKRMLVWSGTGVGQMKQVLPAAVSQQSKFRVVL
jgi:hypothetical protein